MLRNVAHRLALAALVAATGCSLEESAAPALSGPSEFGLSVVVAATPDRLPRDGSSQSVVTLNVRDAQGRPVSGQRLTIAVSPTTASLSASEVVTDASGRATVTVTAPPSASLGNTITVSATPVGTGTDTALARTVTIALTGTANTTAPSPSFTVTPTSPEVNQVTTLDASATTDEGATCSDACTYRWDFGGEATATGRIVTYRFQAARIYNVALTVTDAAGTAATTRTNVTVTAASKPTVTFTVAPTSPTAGQRATFTATTTVASNHRITSIDWNFGDGTSTSTTNNTVNHTFDDPGTFVVTVTVTDDLGQTASTSSSVTVTSGVTASFTNSPTNATTADTVQFNGSDSTSTGGATITTWEWDFGDGSDVVEESDATTTHQFGAARTYVVRLTVTDSNGRTGTTTKSISIASP